MEVGTLYSGSRLISPISNSIPVLDNKALSPHSDTRSAEHGQNDSALHMADDAEAVANKIMEEFDAKAAANVIVEECRKCDEGRATKKRRVRVNASCLLYEPVYCDNAQQITCIAVPNNSSKRFEMPQHAIALWPQYWITFDGDEFPGLPWLFFHRDEAWVKSLLNATKPESDNRSATRDALHYFTAAARALFGVAVDEQRDREAGMFCCMCEEDSDLLEAEADMFVKSPAIKHSEVLEVTIRGYPVSVLKYWSTLAVCMDEKAVQFVRHVLVPLAAKSWELAPMHCGNGSDDCCHAPLPNIPGKVQWHPCKQAWSIEVRNSPQADIPEFPIGFAFDNSMKHEHFMAKLRQYRFAIAAWNRLDRSGRHRIGNHRNLWHLYPCTSEPDKHGLPAAENQMFDLPCSKPSSVSSMESDSLMV